MNYLKIYDKNNLENSHKIDSKIDSKKRCRRSWSLKFSRRFYTIRIMNHWKIHIKRISMKMTFLENLIVYLELIYNSYKTQIYEPLKNN